jgi:hypothetical protein
MPCKAEPPVTLTLKASVPRFFDINALEKLLEDYSYFSLEKTSLIVRLYSEAFTR